MLASGMNGEIEITNSMIVIKRKGLTGFLAKLGSGPSGEKSIPISAITSVQLKKASVLGGNGFIRFCFGGAAEKQGNLKDAINDENAVVFTRKSNEQFEKIKSEVEHRRYSTTAAAPTSAAEEIEKLAKLKDNGYITENEYNEKKKELLSKI